MVLIGTKLLKLVQYARTKVTKKIEVKKNYQEIPHLKERTLQKSTVGKGNSSAYK